MNNNREIELVELSDDDASPQTRNAQSRSKNKPSDVVPDSFYCSLDMGLADEQEEVQVVDTIDAAEKPFYQVTSDVIRAILGESPPSTSKSDDNPTDTNSRVSNTLTDKRQNSAKRQNNENCGMYDIQETQSSARKSPVSISLHNYEIEEVVTQACLTEVQPTTSDAPPAQKKRRRNREELEQEKLMKGIKNVQREIAKAKNTKCEQYLYCYVSNNACFSLAGAEKELKDRFAEREIGQQLTFVGDQMPARCTWKRKCISGYIEDGKLHRNETMQSENVAAIVLEGDAFLQMAKTRTTMDYVKNAIERIGISDLQLTVIVVGKHSVRQNVLTDLVLDIFERLRAQFRFVADGKELSFLVAQMHRALAKREKKMEKEIDAVPILAIEKGIREGPHLVTDWWTRMLAHIHRLSEEQKRALVEKYPQPFTLMDRFLEISPGDAMHEIANVVAGNGRRIGPVIATKLYKVLTSCDGEEILDNAS